MFTKPINLTEKLVIDDESFLQCEPFICQALVNVLIGLKFKIDPNITTVAKTFPAFFKFGYRIPSKTLWADTAKGEISALNAYHEGFHNLVHQRFNNRLFQFPMVTLLNECLGIPLRVYFSASLANAGFEPLALSYQRFSIDYAKLLGKDFEALFKAARKDPFGTYKSVALECFSLHKKIFGLIPTNQIQCRRQMKEISIEMKKSKNLIFHIYADAVTASLFLAHNCGLKSCKADLVYENTLLNDLDKSVSLEEFFKRMGIERFFLKRSKRV